MTQQQTQYYSTNKAQWRNYNLDARQYKKIQANQNMRAHDIVRHVTGSNLTQRMNVLAQILSPTGRVHVHRDTPSRISCFPQSVCWLFPDKAE